MYQKGLTTHREIHHKQSSKICISKLKCINFLGSFFFSIDFLIKLNKQDEFKN